VNINTATASELETLPGVGEVTAQRIIEYRVANGPFETIEEIQNVSGIGPKTFEEMRELIVAGP
jgi:competence protein ComEA